jgi:hypothetical protein
MVEVGRVGDEGDLGVLDPDEGVATLELAAEVKGNLTVNDPPES